MNKAPYRPRSVGHRELNVRITIRIEKRWRLRADKMAKKHNTTVSRMTRQGLKLVIERLEHE